MPVPLSTTLLVAAAVLSGYPGTVLRALTYVFLGLALLNELVRLFVLRSSAINGSVDGRDYTVRAPGRTRTGRNPIIPEDYDGS